MKHPALTRAMAVVLAVLSLVMLLAGFGSLRGARRDRDRGQGDWQRLSGRIDEYELALAQLGSSEPYDDQKKELDREQAEHDQQATEHRMSLATYTATRSGVQDPFRPTGVPMGTLMLEDRCAVTSGVYE